MLAGILRRRMPEVERVPIWIRMARLAISGRGHVVRCLAYRADVVVASGAARCECRMVHLRGGPR